MAISRPVEMDKLEDGVQQSVATVNVSATTRLMLFCKYYDCLYSTTTIKYEYWMAPL